MQFQGGSFDPFGGDGFDQCAILLNEEFERVFYKNNFAAGATIFSIYMVCNVSLSICFSLETVTSRL
jgi:hypothetical protein